MNTHLTIEVDDQIKQLAQQNAKQLGFDLPTVVQMLLKHIALTSKLPAGLLEPTEETWQAIYELESGNNISYYQSSKELKRDLGWE
ncbi:type II toxin-antitoxin system antitoxin, RelB/DinJ family [Muribacter muris]|uniref:Type II toxin-antitoxin system antitoxin, RelB/DinJ family n=1 Tax=Muribacter muris TaxID=67855 RepID=A0A4Y9K303_9PAST|nr:type II toxin-antitoxin system RelB/DinJ family antitoxin [Muribacter muris]MBF0784637.1 type II toxin-antitoxin system RelB/DinJ family antitoxin [Muribacter muris]MBF0828163.1 type II toxin-antitoxin system RelB/DinJ family antitoxin [Muribacter muris]TFV11912.1 type II toxin-antitoxin system antitoxin, RelB/DinJ family [Muribacter muris]